jgi:hypothetical protein
MSDAERKKMKLWGGLIECDEPVPDARTEADKATIEAGLAGFKEHKEGLLEILRNVRGRGPKPKPFDADKAWGNLTRLAWIYFWFGRRKAEVVSAAQQRERLRDLAKVLGLARRKAELAMQDDVGEALFRAWRDVNVNDRDLNLDLTGPHTLVRIDHEFEKLIANLAILEAAARGAADDVRTKDGRPKGRFLPKGCIKVLATVYRDGTGLRPGAGDGPFAKFVMEFLTALGRDDIEYESVIDEIKDERRRVLMASKGRPSPFD